MLSECFIFNRERGRHRLRNEKIPTVKKEEEFFFAKKIFEMGVPRLHKRSS